MTQERRAAFGAERLENGDVSFRFWSPNFDAPKLVLEGEDHSMEAVGEGFYEAVIADVAEGARYAYRIGSQMVPDPASRGQAADVHGDSVVIDPSSFEWKASKWERPLWRDAIVYECHVGTFSEEGTYAGASRKLDHLIDLGVNVLELMPLAQFSGERGWGYDGVLPYAPHRAYGSPDELRQFIDLCHSKGLAVMIDVVYNHFGPDGNYLHLYASDFFDDDQHTPWGAALDFSRQPVRDFFIENAVMWLRDYRFDGIRFDAVHAISSQAGDRPFLEEMSERIRRELAGQDPYLVLENDDNAASLIGSERPYTAQWNDDFHHVLHRIATEETDGYYGDYEDRPAERLTRILAEGFDYQGEPSAHRGGARRGELSSDRSPTAFVAFLQNHDQVGNRAEGERISDAAPTERVEAMTAIYLLSPQVPMLWMGEEWAATSRFPFFCDFHGDLADAVREGRRREFAQFKRFADPEAREAIPDPNALSTFEAAKLDWDELGGKTHSERLDFVRRLIGLRREHVCPVLDEFRSVATQSEGALVDVEWTFGDGTLRLLANLSDDEVPVADRTDGEPFFRLRMSREAIGPWGVAVIGGHD